MLQPRVTPTYTLPGVVATDSHSCFSAREAHIYELQIMDKRMSDHPGSRAMYFVSAGDNSSTQDLSSPSRAPPQAVKPQGSLRQ